MFQDEKDIMIFGQNLAILTIVDRGLQHSATKVKALYICSRSEGCSDVANLLPSNDAQPNRHVCEYHCR